MKQTAVIMAGGVGERFWPQSRVATPKQFLSLTSDGKTMLQLTVERLLPLVLLEDVFIATNSRYKDTVLQQLPGLPEANVLCEPVAKNTAPCIAYAAAVISARYGDAVMYVMPSDHIVKSKTLFCATLQLASQVAEQDENLVTLGITPDYPETGYGYIQFGERKDLPNNVFPVEQFVEKPDAARAQQYLASGNYLWNSGMFIWKASTYLRKLEQLQPAMSQAARLLYDAEVCDGAGKEVVQTAFEMCPSISVDYGILEKAENIYTIPGSFGWDDVGSWLSLSRINTLDGEGNFSKGNVVAVDSSNCIFVGQKRLLAAVGVEGLIVVETEDAVMVCDKESAQEVKKIVQALKAKGQTQFL